MGEAKRKAQVGRLALRHEGEWWNAYYAKPDTMEDAILLGSIKVAFVYSDERRLAFMGIMREAVADLIEREVGMRPTWGGPQCAPEIERAGHG